MAECRAQIESAFAEMRFEFDAPDDLPQNWNAVLGRLHELGDDCTDELRRFGTELLDRAANGAWEDDDRLRLVLGELTRRDEAGSRELAEQALERGLRRNRESYVGVLDIVGDRGSVPALVGAIDLDRDRDPEGWVTRKVLAALTRLKACEVVERVLPLLDDETDEVRVAAVAYLRECGANEQVAEALAARVSEEEDPVALEAIIAVVVEWNRGECVPDLEELARSEWVHGDDQLRTSVEDALEALRSG